MLINQKTGAKHLNNILKLQKQFPKDTANFLILNVTNIIYFTGFSGATALLIPQNGQSTLYVSSTNYEQAKYEAKNVKVEKLSHSENLYEKIIKDTKTSANSKLAEVLVSLMIFS